MGTVFVIIAGFLLGGVVNALADNLPHGRLLSQPRYRDGTARPLVAWLGLSAVVFGMRRPQDESRRERQKLSWRCLITELVLTALMLTIHLVALAKPQISLGQQLLWHLYAILFCTARCG